jgi:uncharacterized protein (DUF58 family)
MARAKVQYRYHVHGPLLIYCLVSLLIAIGAFNSNNNLLFWLFGLAMGMLVVSGVLSGAMLMGVRVEREAVDAGVAGGVVRVRYRVRNVSRWCPSFALRIIEEPATPGANAGGTGAAAGAGAEMVEGRIEAFAAHVPRGGGVVVEGLARGLRRGEFGLSAVLVYSEFPFGLVRKSLRFAQSGRGVIRPAPAADTPWPGRAARAAWPRGMKEDRPTSQGELFYALREYQRGDSPRQVAWRASARRGEGIAGTGLLVRQNAASPEPLRRLVIALENLDASDESAYERGISVAAALVLRAEATGMPVGLRVGWLGVDLQPQAGRRHASALIERLAALPGHADRLAQASNPGPRAASVRGGDLGSALIATIGSGGSAEFSLGEGGVAR